MTTTAMRSLHDLLRIEDHEELLRFKSDDGRFLLWPLIRNQFLRLAISRETGSAWIRLEVHRPWRQVVTSVSRSLLRHMSVGLPRARYLIMATGTGNVVVGGRFFNRLSDHFAAVAPEETLCVESLAAWEWPFPRANERTISNEPYRLRPALSARVLVNAAHRRTAAEILELVSRRAQDAIGWRPTVGETQMLVSALALQIAGLPQQARTSEYLLRRTGARVVLKEEGCYGHSSVFNAVAREVGVIVAEYQHGAIQAGHDAYHFAATLAADPAFQRTLPQYLLTYGDWWNEQVDAPVQTVTVGNPHRTERLLELASIERDGVRTLLVLGDGMKTERHIAFAEDISRRLGVNWVVRFRPHPLERRAVLSNSCYDWNRISLDVERDLYASLFSAHMVIGEASTALFEAIGIVPRIAIWSGSQANFLYPRLPFDSFVDEDDLIGRMDDKAFGAVDASDAERIWAPDWRERYAAFLNAVEK